MRKFRRNRPSRSAARNRVRRIKSRALTRLRRNRVSNVRNRSMVPIGLGFPKKVLVTHRYQECVAVGSTTGSLGKYSFACNGMFDPNITSTGHQPMYFDQFGAIYDQYTVIASKVKFTVVATTVNNSFLVATDINDDTTTTATTISTVGEHSPGKIRYYPGLSGTAPLVLTNKWSAKKYFGGSILGNDNLQGTPAANPLELSYFDFYIQDPVGLASVACNVYVEIEYIAIWTELKDIGPS